jgi:uncharacterized protein
MFSEQAIAQIAGRLAAVSSSPAKVILIGSYARGDATEDSDIDLLVLQKTLADRSAEYKRLRFEILTAKLRADLILMSEEEFEWKSLVGGTLPWWAKQEGRLLHDFA